MHLAILPPIAHPILGRIDFFYLGFLSPWVHRRCPVSLTPPGIRHGGGIHYSHVGAPNSPRSSPDFSLLK
jgi:hypothetical protein